GRGAHGVDGRRDDGGDGRPFGTAYEAPADPPPPAGRPAPPATITVPLVARGKTLGALAMGGSRRQRPYDDDDLAWADDLASRVAIALDNARLFAEARRERRRAEEAARAKEEFLAVVSHELRTPLNAMLGWASMLREGELGEAERARALEIVERNARAQAKLIEDLLDVSRIVSGKLRLEPGPLDLAAVVASAVDAVRPAAEAKGVRLELASGPAEAPCDGDASRLQQVVLNLASNAVKFTPPDGRVRVALAREGAHFCLRVEDTGHGIAPSFLPHVFERFRQQDGSATRAQGGLGLGLAIVKSLVELHGGTVGAESEGEGRGAAFVVRIPAAGPPEGPPSRPEGAGGRRPGLAGLRVLVVDDEEDARELVRALLERVAIDVRLAASAEEALRLVRELRPDALVSDVGMPGEDGYALVRKLRALPPSEGGRTPALALTAYAGPDDRQRALLAGFSMHLPKPVEPADLLVALAAVSRTPAG
ncbi:MAG TPA: ATP-binding protein, partial [Polyangiaceae bacterium]|nr:ATP-binding protein [Polyangiaceae bacterium]